MVMFVTGLFFGATIGVIAICIIIAEDERRMS